MNAFKKNGDRPAPYLSIVIPVNNEASNIAALAGAIIRAMDAEPWTWECLWVDDGSTDGTLSELQRISRENNRHRFVVLDGNFGQSAALYTGFTHTQGKILVTLDGDGQNDPADIPVLVRTLLEQDADMVIGWRRDRKDNWVKKIASRIANGFRNMVTNEHVRDVGCGIKAFHRRCLENMSVFKGMHRFLPTLARMAGCTRIAEIPVAHRPRKYGRTKYGIHNRLWVGLADTLAVCWMQNRLVYPKTKVSYSNHEGDKAA